MPAIPSILSTFAREYLEQILDRRDPDTRAIISCGLPVHHLLCETSKSLSTGNRKSLGRSSTVVKTLIALANDNINSIDFHVVRLKWLLLYTDANLLLAALELLRSSNSDIAAHESIRRLDMATIIAGGVGRERPRWIASLIHAAQERMPRFRGHLEATHHKRRKPSTPARPDDSLYANLYVQEFGIPPSMHDYATKYCNQPFIVRDFAGPDSELPWPALYRWSSAQYLLDSVGEGRVVPVECGEAYVDENWGQKIMSFRTFLSKAGYKLEHLEESNENDDIGSLYLAQHSLFKQFPILEKDFSLPDYVWAQPQTQTPYKPIEGGPIVNVWIGNSERHPVSPAHTDPHFNCYVQVLGQKRIWLAPPSAERDMYVYGNEGEGMSSYMTNTSKVPIFRSDDLEQFPRFVENVVPLAQEAVLSPGDLLVLPPAWWHAMKGEGTGPGWSVSMWY